MVRSNVTNMAAATESATAESSFSDEVVKLMGKGRRHLVCSEVVQAVKCFEEATQKLDGKYGAGSDECGEAYLFFGKALLELARAENGVLGNALKDVDQKSGESSDEDEDEMEAVGPKISEMSPGSKHKIREDVQDAMAEKEEGDAKEEDKNKDEPATKETKIESGTKSEAKMSKEEAVEGEKGEKDGEKEEKKNEKEETEGKEVEEGKKDEEEKVKEDKEGKKDKEAKKDKEEGKADKEDKKNKGEGKADKEEGKADKEEDKADKEDKKNKGEGKTDKEEGKADKEDKTDKDEDKKNKGEAKEGEEEGEEGEEEGEEDEEEEMEGVEEGDEGEGKDGDQEGEGQEEEVDVPTMQSAWEFLELARLVFVRQENKEAQLNLAEVHLKLGEIKLEQEQFATAVEEFQACLDLQMKHLEPDDRLIAETSYSMGLAYSFQPNYSKAHEFFSKALDVIKLKTSKLEARVAEWESKSKGKGKATDDDPCVVDRKELEELQNLYPEIKARVDDAQEMMNCASKQAESVTEEGFGTSGTDSKNVPATTIPTKQPATLIPVRRKRKPEEDSSSSGVAQDTEAPVKKARQEQSQPATPVVTENGHDPNGSVTSTEQK